MTYIHAGFFCILKGKMKAGIYIDALEIGYEKHKKNEFVTYNDVKSKLNRKYSLLNDKNLSLFFFQNFYNPEAYFKIKIPAGDPDARLGVLIHFPNPFKKKSGTSGGIVIM